MNIWFEWFLCDFIDKIYSCVFDNIQNIIYIFLIYRVYDDSLKV